MNPTDTTVDQDGQASIRAPHVVLKPGSLGLLCPGQTMIVEDTEIVSIVPSVTCKNKKKSKLTIAKLYDNMLSVSYTLDNGELNKEKIIQQSYSFTKNK